MQRKEHVDERLAVTRRLGLVFHIGHIRVVQNKGHHPESRQQDRRTDDWQAEPPLCCITVHRQDEHITQEHEQQHDAMAECCQRQQQCRSNAVFTGFQPADEHPEAQNRKSECDRKRELPRHGRRNIAAIDGETLIEQKHRASHHQQLRNWKDQAGQLGEQPRAHRQRQQPRHCDQLQSDAVWQHDVEQQNEDRRHHHVEAIDRQTGIPIVAPPRQTE